MPVNFFDPSEAFNASTAGDVLMVSASRSRKHQWLRGKLGDLYPQVPSNFELGDFIDPVGGGVSERRRAVLNKDTGRPVAAVTERYELIPHRTCGSTACWAPTCRRNCTSATKASASDSAC